MCLGQVLERFELPARLRSPPAAAAGSAASAPSAAAATPTSAAAAKSAALRTRAGFVHRQRPSTELRFVQLGDSLLGVRVASHLDEGEPSGPARRLVSHDADGVHGAYAFEERLQVRFARLERQITDVKLTTHSSSPVPSRIVG
jgi:hypothetical protein